ncbi:unnamed protein product [Arctia plantaginis]|uniref:Uncharacterized protein n=1 Tax=Arctia plantaginis TaxID=874455 RepID=A0A8S1ATD0_ARCPL|nr:unnamed protein product [Arctia plantaginis]
MSNDEVAETAVDGKQTDHVIHVDGDSDTISVLSESTLTAGSDTLSVTDTEQHLGESEVEIHVILHDTTNRTRTGATVRVGRDGAHIHLVRIFRNEQLTVVRRYNTERWGGGHGKSGWERARTHPRVLIECLKSLIIKSVED